MDNEHARFKNRRDILPTSNRNNKINYAHTHSLALRKPFIVGDMDIHMYVCTTINYTQIQEINKRRPNSYFIRARNLTRDLYVAHWHGTRSATEGVKSCQNLCLHPMNIKMYISPRNFTKYVYHVKLMLTIMHLSLYGYKASYSIINTQNPFLHNKLKLC